MSDREVLKNKKKNDIQSSDVISHRCLSSGGMATPEQRGPDVCVRSTDASCSLHHVPIGQFENRCWLFIHCKY